MTGKTFRNKLIKLFGEERWQQLASKALEVHPATIRRWCARKQIPKLTLLAFERLESQSADS